MAFLLHDRAAQRVAGSLAIDRRLSHDRAAKRISWSLTVDVGLGHNGATERVAGGLVVDVLGGRHFEACKGLEEKSENVVIEKVGKE